MTKTTTHAKHTPGPWHVEKWEYPKETKLIIQNGNDATCEILDLWCMDDRTEERDANARLIASAPDLLAACKNALTDGDELRAMNMIKAAIAKAEGRTE